MEEEIMFSMMKGLDNHIIYGYNSNINDMKKKYIELQNIFPTCISEDIEVNENISCFHIRINFLILSPEVKLEYIRKYMERIQHLNDK